MMVRPARPGILLLLVLATIGLAESASGQMLIYGESGSHTPRYRTWDGSSWSSEMSAPNVGGDPYWIRAAACPTRDEIAMLVLDEYDDTNLVIWDGSSWGSVTQIATDIGTLTASSIRPIDLAYEQSSGDLLIVYSRGDDEEMYYRTWNGTSLSSASDLEFEDDYQNWMQLTPRPGTDQIMLLMLEDDDDLHACLWSGSSWGSTTQIEADAIYTTDEPFGFAWESSSGHGLAVFNDNAASTPGYRTWDGASWSGEMNLPSVGADPTHIEMASDPSSDEIICAVVDDTRDLNVVVWNGSSWGSVTSCTTGMEHYTNPQCDVAYELDGNDALLVYTESGYTTARYRTWNGSSWSGEFTGTYVGQHQDFFVLAPSADAGEMFVASRDGYDDVNAYEWSGSSMSTNHEVSGYISGTGYTRAFALVAPPPGNAIVPADLPYTNDFEALAGAEWTDSTTENDADTTTILGRFGSGEESTLHVNTTIGETYHLFVDILAIDSWDNESYKIDIDGTEVFSEAFLGGTGAATLTRVPSIDSIDVGFNASYADIRHDIIHLTWTATGSTSEIRFHSTLNQDVTDESIALDNIVVVHEDDVADYRPYFTDVSTTVDFDGVGTSSYHDATGIGWADFNADGHLDAFFSGNSAVLLLADPVEGNDYDETSQGSQIRQAALLDADCDGDIDVWTFNEDLLLNDGSGTLTDDGNQGFSNPNNNEGIAAADVNSDGWPDLVMFSQNGNWIGHHDGSASVNFTGTIDSSYGLNDAGDVGNGDFCSSADVNNDGHLDFFYHYGTGKLFISDADGTFTEDPHGISVYVNNSYKIGAAWGDYDNDGDMDLFVPNRQASTPGYLWRNDRDWSTGTGSFTDVTVSSGLSVNVAAQRSCTWGDYDNDGDLDLYITADASDDSVLFRNEGDGTFVDMSTVTRALLSGNTHDACFVDHDNDGDLDIAISNESASAVMLHNTLDDTNYLKVRVVAETNGGSPPLNGVRIELWDAAGTTFLQMREIGTARGFGSEPMWAHFGGIDPTATYTLKYRGTGSTDYQSTTLVPNAVSTTIGSTTISQMITLTLQSGRRVVRWREVGR